MPWLARHALKPVYAVAVAGLILALLAAPVRADRGIPVGMYNVNNSVMNSGRYAYAIRFVLDADTTAYRFFSGFNLEGSDFLGGRDGYAQGTGGIVRARLVNVKADGTPDLSSVLADESIPTAVRYAETKAAYGPPGTNQLLFFNTKGVPLQANRMYAMVYTNASPDSAADWFSENSPTIATSVAGPNGRNTLDPKAPGAIAGLDPREVVAWSQDGGASWSWGVDVGRGNTRGAYAGSTSGDDGTRLPWYGIQASAGSKPDSNQPYYAYTDEGAYTLHLDKAPRTVTLVEAGGYGPQDGAVGTVTVRNDTTGASAHTEELGGGLAKGTLDHPLTINAGDSYQISNTGTVYKQEADEFIQAVFTVGSGRWPFSTEDHGSDVAELFALPHPWFTPIVVASAAAAVAPPAPPAPVGPAPEGSALPEVYVDYPHTDHQFRRELRISVRAMDADGVKRVRFYVDGKRIGVDRRAPFKRVWRVPTRMRRGRHTLMAKAVDGHHRIGISRRVTIKRGRPYSHRRRHKTHRHRYVKGGHKPAHRKSG